MSKLRKKYGKLTVLSTFTQDCRGYAHVRCTCGREKDVLSDSLRRGATKSCGHGLCRAAPSVSYDKAFRPRLPRAASLVTVKRLWNEYHSPKGSTHYQLHVKYKLPLTTVGNILRTVRRAGGIVKYLSHFE